MGNPGVCKHGQLARSCEICDLAEQLDAALLKLDRCENMLGELRKYADAWDGHWHPAIDIILETIPAPPKEPK